MTVTELLETVRRVELRTNRLVNAGRNWHPIEFDGFGNCGEFAIIKSRAGKPASILIPPNSRGLEISACAGSRN